MLNVAKSIATAGTRKEKFTDVGTSDMTTGQVLLLLVLIAITLVVYALVGSWLFNNFVCKAVTVVRPITALQFLGLYLAIKILTN